MNPMVACPFCGSSTVAPVFDDPMEANSANTVCYECGAQGPLVLSKEMEENNPLGKLAMLDEARKRWDKRTIKP